MSSAPSTVYLHIGLHKTGTTYLQNLLRANRENLRAQGIDFPGGPGEPVQAFAVWDLQGRRPRGVDDARIAGSWDALVEAVNTSGYPEALVSEERLSLSTLKQAKRAVESFPHSEVHLVVTVRDLGRVAVSAWQEEVKNDQTWRWREFAEAIKDPDRIAVNPGRGFWFRQDVVKICETWESAVPAERLHVVTVPQSGSSPEVLLERFAAVVGFDAGSLTEQPIWNNETVGVAATEVIRRVNERLGGRLNQRQYDKVIKMTVAQMLAKRTEAVRFTLPAEELPWVTTRAERMIEALRSRGYPVAGDLDELRPQSRDGGRRPDDASDEELLEASLDALAMLAERYATSWWQRKKPDVDASATSAVDLASWARGAVFRNQRRAAEIADRRPIAAKAMGLVLKGRDRARRRALRGRTSGPD
ncbi:MAG: hypothetical protein H0U51_02325 [Propionibacteriales bacterium]|nr:hypothetical protein [Propionibacteriales bacterium]